MGKSAMMRRGAESWNRDLILLPAPQTLAPYYTVSRDNTTTATSQVTSWPLFCRETKRTSVPVFLHKDFKRGEMRMQVTTLLLVCLGVWIHTAESVSSLFSHSLEIMVG